MDIAARIEYDVRWKKREEVILMGKRLKRSAAKLKEVRTLAMAGILIALNIVLNMFTVPITPQLRISFGFIATTAIGMLFGPFVAVPAAAVCDVLGWLIHPTGPYFYGFTLTAMLNALICSLIFFEEHDRQRILRETERNGRRWTRLSLLSLASRILVNGISNTLLNTFWLSQLYGKTMEALLPARALKNLIMTVPETVLLVLALGAVCFAWDQVKKQKV